MKLNRSFAVLTGVVFGLLLTLPSGCRQKEGGADVLTLRGRIETIEPNSKDPDTGRITVRYRTEKQPDEKTGHGAITRETEIVINGALAKLGDLKTGDDVRVDVRIEKDSDEPTPVVLKIRVERAPRP